MRTAPLVLLLPMLSLLSAAESFGWQAGDVDLWQYTLKSDSIIETAGDSVPFVTIQNWELKIAVTTVSDASVELDWTVLRIKGKHTGGGVEHVVDTNLPHSAEDPLLGHLHAFANITLQLTLDPVTGTVTRVRGNQPIIDAVASRARSEPGEPSPLQAAAELNYGEASLKRLFSSMFALPQDEPEIITLPAPLTGTATRTWDGNAYVLTTKPSETVTMTWWRHPTPVTAELQALDGKGRIRRRQDGITMFYGKTSAELRLDAMTQPVASRYQIEWSLGKRLVSESSEGEKTDSTEAATP